MNDKVLQAILKFREERDWKQFHAPKNLAMSVAIEAGELMEVFQWSITEAASEVAPLARERAREEMADVAIYLMLLAHDLEIDLDYAILDKVERNAAKYPTSECKGTYQKRA